MWYPPASAFEPSHRIALGIPTAAFALHLAVANRYDAFRDELYSSSAGATPMDDTNPPKGRRKP